MRNRGFWVVAAVAAVVRLVYLIEASGSPLFDLFQIDAEFYDIKAREIVAGDWWSGTQVFTMSPLYRYFLAAAYGVSGSSVLFVKLLQHVIGTASCLLIYRIGFRLAGPVPALVSGLIAAVYGLFLFSEGTFENEFLVIFLSLAAIAILLEAGTPRGRRWIPLAGLCIGLSAGIRPNGILLLLPVLIWLAVEIPRRSAFLRSCLLCLLGAVIPLAAIGTRNLAVSGDWVLTTSTGGQLVYVGTIDGDGGYALPDFVRPVSGTEHDDFRTQMETNLGRDVLASEISGYWIREAAGRIRDDPAAYATLLGKKALAFVGGQESPDNYDYRFNRGHSRILALPWAGFSLVLPLALVGMLCAARPVRRWILPYGVIAVYLITVVLFYHSYRLRLPAAPALILFAGIGAYWLSTRARTPRAWLAGAAILAVGFLLTSNPFPHGDDEMDDAMAAYSYMNMMVEKGRDGDAAAFLLLTHERQPRYHRMLGRAGADFMSRGQYRLAIGYLDPLRDDPEFAQDATRDLVICLIEIDELPAASALAHEGTLRFPELPGMQFLYGDVLSRQGLIAQARVSFGRTLQMDPKHLGARAALEGLGPPVRVWD